MQSIYTTANLTRNKTVLLNTDDEYSYTQAYMLGLLQISQNLSLCNILPYKPQLFFVISHSLEINQRVKIEQNFSALKKSADENI